jgi:hypothetical protein
MQKTDTNPAREFPLVIQGWTIKRSGPSMTITGEDAAGKKKRVPGVYAVSPSPNGACAWGFDAAGKVIVSLI